MGLFAQGCRRSRRLFHQRGVLLGHAVHHGQGIVDLRDTLGLLGTGGCNVAHNLGHFFDGCNGILHGCTGLCDLNGAAFDLADRVPDQRLDLMRSGGGALGQRAHFRGHHGKPAPLFARPRRLHRRVEGQDVGLESNAVDHGNDVHDLA